MNFNDFKEEAQNVYCFRNYNRDITDVVPAILHPSEFNRLMQKFYKAYKKEIKEKSNINDPAYKKWKEKLKRHSKAIIENDYNKKFSNLIKKQEQLEHLLSYLEFNEIKTLFNISYNVGLRNKDLNALQELDYIYLDENQSYKCNFDINDIFDVATDMLRSIKIQEL